MSSPTPASPEAPRPTFAEALRFWAHLGCVNFGGPTAQIAILHREVVERRRWISEDRFLHALSFCMLMPGPEAQQLATYLGWLLHRVPGAIAAGVLFVAPSIGILLALSWIYVRFGSVPVVEAAFQGVRPAVAAIVAVALWRIGGRVLRHPIHVAVAAGAFVAIYALRTPFPLVIGAALAIGLVGARFAPALFTPPTHSGGASTPSTILTKADFESMPRPGWKRTLRVLSLFLLLWAVPFFAIVSWRGGEDVFAREALFFTKAALITFGGAYAVLPYVAQQAVERFSWLTTEQMIDGLGLAETTPGPLIMVLQFVGFMAAWNQAGLGAGGAVIGGLIATYFTFLPSFAWILLGAPSIERVRGEPRIAGALAAVTAAVVGVMANLGVWFGVEVIQDPWSVGIALAALVVSLALRWGVAAVVVAAAAASVARHLAGLG